MDYGDRLAPVALAGEDPVAQLVVDLRAAEALLLEPLGHGRDGGLDAHAVQEAGVHHYGVLVLAYPGLLGDVAALDDLDYGQAELLRELPVALVVARDGHDGARAVAREDVVGDEDGDDLAVHGVDGVDAHGAHAGLVLVELGALEVGLRRGLGLVLPDLVGVRYRAALEPLPDELVLRREDHVGRAEERVAAGGEDLYDVAGGGLEVDLRAGGAAYPVALLNLDALDVVDVVEVVYEPLGVGGDAQHPLALLLAHDGRAAALADALHDLLVGEDALAARAPVDGHAGLIREAVLVHLEEYPLGPLVVLRVRGIHDAVPVEAVAEHLQLLREALDVALGDLAGVHMVLYGVVLRRQAEGVEAYREDDVLALHAPLARDDVHRGVGARVADVEAVAAGIGELDEGEELLPRLIAGDGGEGLVLQPVILPFLFYACEIVAHFLCFLPYKSLVLSSGPFDPSARLRP